MIECGSAQPFMDGSQLIFLGCLRNDQRVIFASEDKKRQTEHRTATTTYLCYLPVLEDSAGAGRAGLLVQRYKWGTIKSSDVEKNDSGA